MTLKQRLRKLNEGLSLNVLVISVERIFVSPSLYGDMDCCGDGTDNAGDNGFILQHTGGFYSKHDCETETLVLCDDCFFELVKEIKSKK